MEIIPKPKDHVILESITYPFQGYNAAEVQDYFVKFFTPYKDLIDQIQNALFLGNIPLYGVLLGCVVVSTIILNFIQRTFGSLALGILIYPYLCLINIELAKFKNQLFVPIAKQDQNSRSRIRSLEELSCCLYKPLKFIWIVANSVKVTFTNPCEVDIGVLAFQVILVSIFAKCMNFVFCFGMILIILIIIAPIAVKTTLIDQLIQLIYDQIKKFMAKKAEKAEKKKVPAPENKNETPVKVEEKKDETPVKVEEKKDEMPLNVEEKKDEMPVNVEEKKDEEPVVVEEKKDDVPQENAN